MHKLSKAYSDMSYLWVSTVISRLFLFMRDIILASLLGPVSYGVWTQLVVMLSYALHLPLGYQNLLSRDVPYYMAKGDALKVKVISDMTFFVSILTSLIAIAIVGLVFFTTFSDTPILGLSWLGIGSVIVLILMQQVNAYYSVLLRAYQQFYVYSVGVLIIAVLGVIIGVLLAYYFGLVGMLIGMIVSFILVNAYWANKADFNIRAFRYDAIYIKKSLNVAVPLFFIGLINVLIISMDRLLISFWYENDLIGYYGLAFMVNQSIFLITGPVLQAIYPRLMSAYSKSEKIEEIKNYLYFLTQTMSSLVIVLIGVIYLISENIITLLLPQFVYSIDLIHILLIGSIFHVIANSSNSFLIAVGKQENVLTVSICTVVIQFFVIISLAVLGYEMKYVAIGMVICFFVYSIISLLCVSTCVGFYNKALFKYLFNTLIIAFYPLGLLLVVKFYYVDTSLGLVDLSLRLVCWLVLVIPFLVFMNRNFRIVSLLR